MGKVFSIEEVKRLVTESSIKRMLPCDQSEINRQIMRDHELGFEAVLTGDGDEKILLPEDGAVVYLFRGQNQEFKPCYPSLYRTTPRPLSNAEIFLWRMRLVVFRDMVDSYPIVEHFFNRHNFKVDYEGLAQHYGLYTSVLDLTSNLDIALFFATCRYDRDNDCYRPYDDGEEHDGILYVFCPMLANEPTPLRIGDFMKENITPIGLQPFLRPARQKGYALHIRKGCSTKSWAYRIKFSDEDSRHYYEMFHGGEDLWISDILADKTKEIAGLNIFSFRTFERAFEEYRPAGYPKRKLKRELQALGVSLQKQVPEIGFNEQECIEAIENWNDHTGREFCDTIGRRSWYLIKNEPKEIPETPGEEIKVDVGNVNNFRSLQMIAEMAMISTLAHPEGPDEAEWINYKNTPNETHRLFNKGEQGWTKVPAKFVNLFAKRYLTEEDYLI